MKNRLPVLLLNMRFRSLLRSVYFSFKFALSKVFPCFVSHTRLIWDEELSNNQTQVESNSFHYQELVVFDQSKSYLEFGGEDYRVSQVLFDETYFIHQSQSFLYDAKSDLVIFDGRIYGGMHPRTLHGRFYSTNDFVLNRRIIRAFKEIKSSNTVAIVSTRNDYNYYHFVTELIPKLLLLLDENVSFDQIIGGRSNQGKLKEMLYFLELGHIEVGISEGNHLYQFQNSIVPSYISPAISPYKVRLYEKFVRSKIRFNPSRKIYISRSKAKIRKLTNESEVTKVLKDYGFEIVYLESMSFLEQIELFSQAEIVMSVHGAALTNILFCDKSVKIVELFSKNMFQEKDPYYLLANYLGMQYFMIEGGGELNYLTEFEIEIKQLQQLLLDITSPSKGATQ